MADKYKMKPAKFLDGIKGDQAKGIDPLEPEEIGVYAVLFNRMYLFNGPIHDDDRDNAAACNATLKTYRRIKKKLISKGKIWVVESKMMARHVEEELKKIELNRLSAHQAGKKSGEVRSRSSENSDLQRRAVRTLLTTHNKKEARARERNQTPESQPVVLSAKQKAAERWRRRCSEWLRDGDWPDIWGTPPDRLDTFVPPNIRAELGIKTIH